MVQATNQGMFTNQSSTPSSGFVYVIGNRTFNTAEEAKQYLARNPGAGTISRVPFQNVTAPTISTGLLTPSTSTSTTDPYKYTQYQTDGIVPPNMSGDTTTQTEPTGTPTTTTQREPTTTTQREPTGTPTSDPTKTEAGETGPFDPNAEPPAPAPAPAPAPETSVSSAPQYYITDPRYSGSRGSEHGYEGGGLGTYTGNFLVEVQPTDEAGLRDYYQSQPLLENQFGSFENFKSYSAEYASLLNESLGTANPWWDIPEEDAERFQAEATLDQEELGLSDVDFGALAANQAIGSVASYLDIDLGSDYQLYTEEAEAGNAGGLYYNFAQSEAVQALNERYGINPEAIASSRFVGDDGDIWYAQWNGSVQA